MSNRNITEEMSFRQSVCEYAKKHGVTKAARKYRLNRMFIYRQFDKWDGSVRSLVLSLTARITTLLNTLHRLLKNGLKLS